jgi:hypothetical protein
MLIGPLGNCPACETEGESIFINGIFNNMTYNLATKENKYSTYIFSWEILKFWRI